MILIGRIVADSHYYMIRVDPPDPPNPLSAFRLRAARQAWSKTLRKIEECRGRCSATRQNKAA
jgi:hypothetical protein